MTTPQPAGRRSRPTAEAPCTTVTVVTLVTTSEGGKRMTKPDKRLRNTKLLSGVAFAAALSLAAVPRGRPIPSRWAAWRHCRRRAATSRGRSWCYGLEWAVDDVNAAGGLLGKQVELIIEDTRNTPASDRGDRDREAHHLMTAMVGRGRRIPFVGMQGRDRGVSPARGPFRHRFVLGGFPHRGRLRRGLSHQRVLVEDGREHGRPDDGERRQEGGELSSRIRTTAWASPRTSRS